MGSSLLRGGKGNTVIDYVMGSVAVRERIIEMRVEDKMDSDHHPLQVKIRREGNRGGKRGKTENMEGDIEREGASKI